MPRRDADVESRSLTEIAYAKINLALHVRARRDDGYHALESLFVFAEDGDVLQAEARSDDRLELQIDGPFGHGLSTGPDNLVLQAAAALRDDQRSAKGATIRLTKNLPIASGIGGGSADAAAALRLLTQLWHISISDQALVDLALNLGSDVPACLASVSQIVRGRGELIEKHELAGLAGAPLLLVNPLVALSTARIFNGWDRIDRGALDATSLGALITHGRNDLQTAATRAAPIIAEVLGALRALSGVTLTRMSGSGATCFALFENEAARDVAAKRLQSEREDWWIMPSRIRHA